MKRHSILLGAACWLFLIFHLSATVFYVDVNSTNPVPPYADWSTASTDIQSAIDAASDGDLILVTNGVYRRGGRVVYDTLTNRVVINKALTVQSVNGPAVTSIFGFANNGSSWPTNSDNAVRCVYLTNNAALVGFTLAFGATRSTQDLNGGGAWCEGTNAMLSNCILTTNSSQAGGGGIYSGMLTNCVLIGNKTLSQQPDGGGGAKNSFLVNCSVISNLDQGGAVYQSVLNNCIISKNNRGLGYNCTAYNCLIVSNTGEGVYYGRLNNCTVTRNGGVGVTESTANNSIIYYNTNSVIQVEVYQSKITNCCVNALGNSYGPNNITDLPAFVDLAHGDFHLQVFSPCINTGTISFRPDSPARVCFARARPMATGSTASRWLGLETRWIPTFRPSAAEKSPVAPM